MTDLHSSVKLEGLLSGDTIELAGTAHERIAKKGNTENLYEVILDPFADSIVPKFYVAHGYHPPAQHS